MKTAHNFYHWWQNTIKGNYIRDSEFEGVLERLQSGEESKIENNLKIVK